MKSREASESTGLRRRSPRELLLMLPNFPAPDVSLTVSTRTTTSKFAGGGSGWTKAHHSQPSPSISAWRTGILDRAGHLRPGVRGEIGRLNVPALSRRWRSARPGALGFFALERARSMPTKRFVHRRVALTETMMSTGHLPKSADDMYAIERDGLWAIPTAEVPLTSHAPRRDS